MYSNQSCRKRLVPRRQTSMMRKITSMSKVKSVAFGALCLLPLIVPAARGSIGASPTEPSAQAAVPPGAIWKNSPDDLRMSASSWASVSIVGGEKVELKWRYSPGADEVKKDVLAEVVQTLIFEGTVTSVAPGPSGELLVSTFRRNGATQIEKVVVESPLIVYTASGVSLSPKPVVSQELLYQGIEVGKHIVRFSIQYRGQSGQYLVQFHDSRDMYVVSTSQTPAVLSMLLSSQSEPLLLVDYNKCSAGEHTSSGYVYYFTKSNPNVFAVQGSLYLIDADKDSSFEFIGKLNSAVANAMGLLTMNTWVEKNSFPVEELLHSSLE